MKIYHGTTERFLPSILKNGLRPRRKQSKGNWVNNPSLAGRVYLTDAYPLYFGFSATKEHEKVVVLEIDMDALNPKRFYPDEDFIGQVLYRENKPRESLIEYTKTINIEYYKHEWQKSLMYSGTIAYHGRIKPEAITRYALVDIFGGPYLISMASDPIINIMNYRILEERHKNNLIWLFDGTIPEHQILDNESLKNAPDDFIAHFLQGYPGNSLDEARAAYREMMIKERDKNVLIVETQQNILQPA